MSSKDWKPWWARIGDYATPAEKEEFMRGVSGAAPKGNSNNILFALIAGYVGGRISQRPGKK